jgi:hypothetical protein|tara:strand:- start:406 stop:1551 length:1146 start_codon:yes stop_codon:yes gene_type:complete
MENENFNWIDAFVEAQERKDIKNSKGFEVLNSNNIDTNELTNHEKDKDAGVIELNYKDEKQKEIDNRSYVGNVLAFILDMPEETVKSLMLAALNGTDVAANVVGTVFNALTDVDEEIHTAHKNSDYKKFSELTTAKIQEFSKYLNGKKTDVKEYSGNITGIGSELDSKAAEMVSWITQDAPYVVPIRKKLKNMGLPDYIAIPIAFGIGTGIAFDDDASLFLNSEQVQGFKEMAGALPDSSEEKIFNTTYRMLEATGLGFAVPGVVKALSFAKNNIPKYMNSKIIKPQNTIAVGGSATATAATQVIEKNIVGPSTDAEIDEIYGEGKSEEAMIEATDLTDANIDEIYGEGSSEQAMDEVLINNEKEDNWKILNSDKQTSYTQ